MSEEPIDVTAKKAPAKGSLFAKLRIAGIVIAAILVMIVASRNWETVTIDLFGIKATMPQAIMMILTFLFGLGLGVLFAFLRPWRKKKR